MSLTTTLVIAGAVLVSATGAMVAATIRALRREDMGPAEFGDVPVLGRHARPEVASEPPAEFLAAPIAAPPEVSHDEYAPPPMLLHGHAHMDGGVLTPVLAPAFLAVAVLRAQIAAATEAQRREDEARFPWLASGQYSEDTGAFTAIDAEIVKAGEAA